MNSGVVPKPWRVFYGYNSLQEEENGQEDDHELIDYPSVEEK